MCVSVHAFPWRYNTRLYEVDGHILKKIVICDFFFFF